MIPFAIDNDQHRLSDVLNALLGESSGKPLDTAMACFSITAYQMEATPSLRLQGRTVPHDAHFTP